MAKIFISFLGTGVGDPSLPTPGYHEVLYRFEDGNPSHLTRFAQRAIIEKHGPESFDRICLLMTEQSKTRHRQLLIDELVSIGCLEHSQIQEDDSITTNQNAEQQWEWFDALQKLIDDGDQVIFDFTHGFRSVPIIFSTAISFLQKVKRFELLHAYYGYVDQKAGKNEIIDMAKFYRINEWADGVARLVDTADASKLAALAEEGKDDGFAALNDPKLVKALRDLTNLIKNIDVNNVGKKADEALNLIQQKSKQCSGADKQLLQMVIGKFEGLAITTNNHYDNNYFKLQLVLTEILLKHGLYMQAFTVMRECIGTLVMVNKQNFPSYYLNQDQAKLRYTLSDMFISIFNVGKLEDSRHKNKQEFIDIVAPFYKKLVNLSNSPIPILRSFVKDLSNLRNGFSHAWVSKNGVPQNIEKQAQQFLVKLEQVIKNMQYNNLI